MSGNIIQPGGPGSGNGLFAEAVRVSPELVGVVVPLILTLFADRDVMPVPEGRLVAVQVAPQLDQVESRRLLGFLFQLVDRPEWKRRCTVAREVTDVRGRRCEVVVPLTPGAYDAGEALVGPFQTQDAANEWAAGVAQTELAFDTMLTAGGYLIDLFLLGELLDD